MYRHNLSILIKFLLFIFSQQSEDGGGKDVEEEGALKIIPKWKASQITEIILEPEPEEEEVSLIRDHSGTGTRGGRCQIIISF